MFKITPGGLITQIADATGDGLGNVMTGPSSLAVDGTGNVFVSCELSDNVFRISPGGTITQIMDVTGDGVHPVSRAVGISVNTAGTDVAVSGFESDNAYRIQPGECFLVIGNGPAALLLITATDVHAERLLGFSIGEDVIFKIDTDTGEIVKFFGHPVFNLGGLDIDDQGNLYYLGSNTVWRIDLGQPANDQFIGSTPKVIFESFEIIDGIGYSGEVFTGTWYAISLTTGEATPLGQYGGGGVDRVTGLASTDYPGSLEPVRMYGQRVFLDDMIEIDPKTGANLGVVVQDKAFSTTNLARGAEGFWFIDGENTLFTIDLTLAGTVTPVLFDLDIPGCNGLTAVHPEPFIVTETLPDGVVGEPYGPLALEHGGGAPGIQWVALSEGYEEVNLGENQFALVGSPLGLNGDDVAVAVPLPFPFPYYGESYTTVYVCNNGFLDFDGPFTDPNNSNAALLLAKRICPLWDNLRTDFGNRDVHVATNVPGQITFRWDVVEFEDFGVCNFSCTLHETGVIQFDYGLPNNSITPTVGISAGDGVQAIISRYSGEPSLHTADSLRFLPVLGMPPGLGLSSNGIVDGVPTETGSFTATVQLTDSLGGFDERVYSIDILDEPVCAADVTGPFKGFPDGVVDVLDLVYVILQWGMSGPADFTGPEGTPDGVVDVLDLVGVILGWGDC